MRKLKRWLNDLGSVLACWRYRRKAHDSYAVKGMSREQAIKCGFIHPKQDAAHFDRMDAWSNAREEADTVETAINSERNLTKRAKLKEQVAKAQAALGIGNDVNSLAWQELINRRVNR